MPPTRDNGASLYRVWLVDLFLSACRSGIGNQAAFNNALRAKENHDLNVYKLPETMFPSGTMYFSPAFADRRASAVVVHNNFIVGHHAKRQRFVDYGLWYLPTDAINPLRSLRVHPEGGGLHGTTALPQARYTAHVAAEQRSKELPRAGSIRHPEEELVTLTVLLRGSWRFVAEEPLSLSISLMGVVAGASYTFRVTVSELREDTGESTVFDGTFPYICSKDAKELPVVTSLSVPPLDKQGAAVLEIWLADAYPGLSEDEAYLSYTRRSIEFWSEGCRATVLWPPPPDGRQRPGCSKENQSGVSAVPGVTLATTASIERVLQFFSVTEHWDGPVSAALYARNAAEERGIRNVVGRMSKWLSDRREGVTIVIVTTCYIDSDHQNGYAFPINVLRYHAIACAQSDLVWFVDVDFIPSENAAQRILAEAHHTNFSADVLVVPCWKEGSSSMLINSSFPRAVSITSDTSVADHCSARKEAGKWEGVAESGCDMQITIRQKPVRTADLLPLVANGQFVVPGANHLATNYYSWIRGAEDKREGSFKALYTLGWEPYIVVNKSNWRGLTKVGLFDRRFRARGFDKASFVYETATLGYQFRVLHGVFLVHVDANINACPSDVFGSDFCSEAYKTDQGDWHTQHESSRDLFAGFIHSLSRERAFSGKGDTEMEKENTNWCLIFPFAAMRHLSISFIHMWLDQAYQAHVQTLSDLHDKLASNSEDMKHLHHPDQDWMATHLWSEFSASWCISVPALVGRVKRCHNSIILYVDARVLEASHDFQSLSEHRYRHYVSGVHGHFLLQRQKMRETEIEFAANVQLDDVCVEVSKDEFSTVWQCPIHTLMEDVRANTSKQLHRESIMVENDFGEGLVHSSSTLDDD